MIELIKNLENRQIVQAHPMEAYKSFRKPIKLLVQGLEH